MMNELARFAATHPPQVSDGSAVPDSLPDQLAELWRVHGPGPYGDRLIRLVDPRVWQPILDRWIVTPPNETRRVPIALTPFGTLLYHRQLSTDDEDVAALDPFERSTMVLSWDLTTFFNETLADPEALDELVPAGMLAAAIDSSGPLGAGEIYEVDRMLLPMQMLKITRTDALSLHTRLRDAVDIADMPDAPPAESLDAALPPEHRAAFADVAWHADGVGGLYLSVYFDWRRLLALVPGRDPSAGTYRLLFWRNHQKTGAPSEVRFYNGKYETAEEEGDTVMRLAIALRNDSLGSDTRDADLVLMRDGETRWLLRSSALADVATRIDASNHMGRSEAYLRSARLEAPLPDVPPNGPPAPAQDVLPAVLRKLLRTA